MNPFGSPQEGAFQVPDGSVKPSLFPGFGQQTSSGSQGQSLAFLQPLAFGGPPAVHQPGAQGGSIFGQPPAQPQPSTINPPAFGQPSLGPSSSAPAFGLAQNSVFGQPSAFGQPPGLGKPPPAFGSPHKTLTTSNSGLPSFGQPPSSSVFSAAAAAQNLNQNRGLAPQFSFKPPNEAVFKPIFSGSPEPTAGQTPATSGSSFGVSGPQSSSGGFSLLAGPKSGPLGFSFTQPAAPASVSHPASAPNGGLPQFTFSNPAAPTAEPTTPSSFSFSQPTLFSAPGAFGQPPGAFSQPPGAFSQPPGIFSQPPGASSQPPGASSHPPAFGDPKAEFVSGDKDSNVFARLSKAPKRKEDPAATEQPAAEEDAPSDADSPRPPAKRPVVRSRAPAGGLFGRALSGIRKEQNPASREVTGETGRPAANPEDPAEPRRDEDSAERPDAETPTEAAAESSQSSEPGSSSAALLTPVRPGERRDSLDGLAGVSPGDLTAIMCKNVPPRFNKKDAIERHFSRFGRVSRVFCRPNKNLAIVHFDDHASAGKAKKRGKMFHRHELLLLWQRRRQSPADKGGRAAAAKDESAEDTFTPEEAKPSSSSAVRRPTLMPPTLGSHPAFRQSSSPVKRPSPARQLPFESEAQRESFSETPERLVPSSAVPSSLLHLIGQVADTAEDKYRLLEQRDKVLRQGRPKRTDLDLSRAFVGTCPDMCPEKERYMRETRNQLSVYEVVPNTEMVDHAAAIKEYSRSSADQEEPLPHDLRPLPVLGMTMDYLVTQIMDQGQDNLRDWYDFVWNRTRGIRKDITQQRLCCPLTVALIEKCARFHVHCAHHLCEQHAASFDAKINNENMTKCLQSLKEMYEDLAARRTFCLQEAEFRQYNVLLKLNNGDILREVQQFRDDVRKSPEVKFAVQAFAAVNSNNFVRFFKLVKGASYLSSCLLHRYFNQVRSRALKALNMAHTVGPRSTVFPVDDIVRMLMFRSAAEASDFIQQFGLNVNDGMVELSRTAFQEPELPPSPKRSEVILAKKAPLIGQVVNGGPLPNPPQHIPVCSFDSQNRYRRDGSVKAEVVEAEVRGQDAPAAAETGGPCPPAARLFQPIPPPEPVRPPSPPVDPRPVYDEEDIAAEGLSIVEEVVEAEVGALAAAAAGYARAALVESGAQLEVLVGEVLEQMLKEISAAEMEMERQRVAEEKLRLEEARRRQEHEAFLARFSFTLCSEIVDQVVHDAVTETAASVIQQALNEKAEHLAKCSEQICRGLIEETVKASLTQLAEGVLEAELERIHKFIKRWRDVVAVRRQLKRQMRSFPAAPCCVDPRFKLRALAPSAPATPSMAALARGLVDLGNAGVLAVSSTRLLRMRRSAVHQMRVHAFHQQLLEEASWKPLDLPALVAENIPNPADRIFWKALLLLPSDEEREASLADRVLSDWLEVKLGGDGESETRGGGTLKSLCVFNSLQENGARNHQVHVTVKTSRGPLSDAYLSLAEEHGELHGAAAILVLLPALPGQQERDVPLLSALLQLKQLQQISSWSWPLPLVILAPWQRDPADEQRLEEALMLRALMEELLISEYLLVFIPDSTSDLQGSQQLTRAVRWLLARSPPPPPLCCQTLVQIVEASLSRDFLTRVYSNRQNRADARLPPQDAAPVVSLYNAVLAHVAEAVTSPDLSRLSWPPGEFSRRETAEFLPLPGWNCAQHLSWLRDVILSLQLPEWEELPGADSWSDLCSAIFRYAGRIGGSRHSRPLLLSRLENILERIRLSAQHSRPAGSGPMRRSIGPVSDTFASIPWDDVVLIFIDHKLRDWHPPSAPALPDAVTEDGEILVHFLSGSVDGFWPPAEWMRAVDQTHRETQRGDGATGAPPPASSFILKQRLFQGSMVAPEAPGPRLDLSYIPTAEEQLAHRVLQSLKEEKAESRRNLEQMQRWLDGDPLDQLSTPLFVPSSTLLFSPTAVKVAASSVQTGAAAALQIGAAEERPDRPPSSRAPAVSLAQRLKHLQRQIAASREEELACRLKLSGMLSIVDD